MWLHDLGLVLEAGEHDGFKRFHNRSNFHTGNQKYFNLKAKLFYLLQRLKMGNFLLKHPSPAEINGNQVKSVFSYRLQSYRIDGVIHRINYNFYE